MSDIEDIILDAGGDICDLVDILRERRRPARLDDECAFAADWTMDDLTDMTERGRRMLP